MPPIPPKCQALKDELDALMQERADLQYDLQAAAGSAKAPIVGAIRKLAAQINQKRVELDRCLGIQLPPAPLTCTLSGMLSTSVKGTMAQVTLVLIFSGDDRSQVDLQFPAVTFPETTPLLVGTATCGGILSLDAAEGFGTFDATLGNISVPLTLTVNFKVTGGGGICKGAMQFGLPSPSTLRLTSPGLTTGTVKSSASPIGSVSGVPLNATTGLLTLAGSGACSGGITGIQGGVDILLTGTLSPIPK